MTEILPRAGSLKIAEAIRSAAAYLEGFDLVYGHGTGSAVDDAAWLVLESAGLSPIDPPDYDARFPASALAGCEEWLRRRALDRVPAAYLTGRTWFAGLEFVCDERALVPRSPIAELLVDGYAGLFEHDESCRILDLCTGGGCIAVATAVYFSKAQVVGSDLSEDALALAESNRALHHCDARVQFVCSDLFEQVSGTFDLIVSNPPYVDRSDISTMGDEFLHEPALGLASGVDGLDITRRILAAAADFLNPAGHLIVEVGNSAQALEDSHPDLPFRWFDFEHGGGGVFILSRDELNETIS